MLTVYSYQNISHCYEQLGNLKLALDWAEKDLGFLRDLAGEDDPDFQAARSEFDELALRVLNESDQIQH